MNMHTAGAERPTQGSKTGRVWELADMISRETGSPARREEVIKRYKAEGGNAATASTQYSHWKKASLNPPANPTATQDSLPAIVLSIAQDGRVLIPQELRLQMRLGDEGKVTARIENGELRLISPPVALERLHRMIKSQDKGPGSAVDDLLAQRRLEAKSE